MGIGFRWLIILCLSRPLYAPPLEQAAALPCRTVTSVAVNGEVPHVAELGNALMTAEAVSRDPQHRLVGIPVSNEATVRETIFALMNGDKKALQRLGVDGVLPDTFTAIEREWGVGRTEDGKFILVVGTKYDPRGGAGIQWKFFPWLHPLAHSHPLTPYLDINVQTMRRPDRRAHTMPELLIDSANQERVLPSAGDFKFCADRSLASHTVITPYLIDNIQTKKSWFSESTTFDVYNRGPNQKGLPLEIDIVGAKRLGDGDIEATLVGRVGERVIWRQKLRADGRAIHYNAAVGN